MPGAIEKLCEIAGPALGPPISTAPDELRPLYQRKNGFYAFESALHVLPIGALAPTMNLEPWNDDALWRDGYSGAARGLLCFAEDIFGEQFALSPQGIVRFEPEAGTVTPIAATVEEWAKHILSHYPRETGHPLAHAWQQTHGALAPGQRLVPRQFFVLGGAFEVDNLVAMDAAQAMRLRAQLYRKIANLPDGTKIRISTEEPEEH